jgi:hypothetical protein
LRKRWGKLGVANLTAVLRGGNGTERMMKLHDVLLKAMAKKITLWEAAEIIGVTDRTMRRR